MSTYCEIDTKVDIDLDDYLDEFDDRTLIKELKYRGYNVGNDDLYDGHLFQILI